MRKFNCGCNNRNFTVDQNNAGRIICSSCGAHYYWNGQKFVKATKLKIFISKIKSFLGIEKKPCRVPPEKFEEIQEPVKHASIKKGKLKKILKQRMQARALQEQTVLLPKAKKNIVWSKVWYEFIFALVQVGSIKVHKHQHIGKARGKNIVREVHRKLNELGLKSTSDFKKARIIFNDDTAKAYDALKTVTVNE